LCSLGVCDERGPVRERARRPGRLSGRRRAILKGDEPCANVQAFDCTYRGGWHILLPRRVAPGNLLADLVPGDFLISFPENLHWITLGFQDFYFFLIPALANGREAYDGR